MSLRGKGVVRSMKVNRDILGCFITCNRTSAACFQPTPFHLDVNLSLFFEGNPTHMYLPPMTCWFLLVGIRKLLSLTLQKAQRSVNFNPGRCSFQPEHRLQVATKER